MASASFNRIHSALVVFQNDFGTKSTNNYSEVLEVQSFDDSSDDLNLCNDLYLYSHQLDRDWMFLRMFTVSIDKWTDAGKLLQDSRRGEWVSLVVTIEAVADDIAKELWQGVCCSSGNLSELLNLLEDCKRRTDPFKVEIGHALDYLSQSGCSYQVHWNDDGDNDYSHWSYLFCTVIEGLLFIENTSYGLNDPSLKKQAYALHQELNLMEKFLYNIKATSNSSSGNLGNDDLIRAFLTHIASVLVRTANQYCNYWISLKTDQIQVANSKLTEGLLSLKHEIDPTNLEFLDFSFNFLKALCKFSWQAVNFVKSFFQYLVTEKGNSHLKNELESLVTFVIYSKLEDDNSREDVQSICAEIVAMLVEAASLHETVRKEVTVDCPSCSELLTKVRLLKAECFLKEQLEEKPFSQKIGELNEFLESQRRFTTDLSHENIESENQMLALTEEVAEEVASLYQHANKIKHSTVKNSLFRLLFKIVIFKAESFLIELLKSTNASFMVHGKDQIQSLLEDLKFFKRILTNQLLIKIPEDMQLIIIQIQPVFRRITFYSYLFHANKVTEDMIKKIIIVFDLLLEKGKQIKAELRENSPQFPKFLFPKTYEVGFVDFLLRNLRELLKMPPESIVPVKHHIEEIEAHLRSVISFLIKVFESNIDDNPELKVIGNQIMDVAYKIEYLINSMEFDSHWVHLIWFYDQVEELKLLSKQTSNIYVPTCDDKVQNVNHVVQVSRNKILQDGTRAMDEMMLDLRDEDEVIIDRLIRGSLNRNIVSIVGMPGIGKTTLARKVYNCKQVKYHFHRRAWCTVSQIYEKRELLIEILSDIEGHTGEIHQMSNPDLESKLRQSLLKNKYLIVMDDIWDTGAWNDLENSFPDDRNGSRILITSRLHNVALEIKPHSDPHPLRSFSDDESWMLLEKKIFRGEGCPEEFLLVGKKIAKQCKGLPLAVVAIAGLLERTQKRRDWWEKIAESLSSEIMKDTEAQCMEILELSYKHLPGHLKACFLYLAVFLEDKDIPVNKLIRFWLAEGFIQKTKSKSLEDVAEDYLMDLINRSLVIVSKRRSNGKVKTCRLHDLIRDLCWSKVKEENFVQLVTRSDEPYASFPGSDYGFEFDFDHHLDPVPFEAYRLSIFLKRNQFVDSRPSGLGTHSLIFFASSDSEPRCPYDISFICQNFKFLRVLDLECINLGISFPDEIGLLVQLRYLAVSGYMHDVPRSIANLWKLETFSVKGFRGKVILPDTIWHMSSLRHLHVNKHVAFNLPDEEVGSSFELYNLVSFSSPALSFGEDTEKILKKLPNLFKLRCIFLESWDSSNNCNQFPRLDILSHLESLKILYYGRALNPSELILPQNLKSLTLSHFHLPWNHISTIGRLPKLQVLKLLSGAFDEQRWDMRKEEFQELKFLKLDTMNIAQWNASRDHLPKLERLVLQNCKDLEKIPDDFEAITTLEMIEVHWCGQSVEESAKEIGEETGEIKVLISSSLLRSSV